MEDYNDLYIAYEDDLVFKIETIKIYYKYNYLYDPNNSLRAYRITRIDSDIYDKLSKADIESINRRLNDEQYIQGWQLFYLYKELVQLIGYTYYRGQARDYSLRPGILRTNTSTSYRKQFEMEYRKLVKAYLKRIQYYSIDANDKRASQLSILQHYGLRTNLLDITDNPYVAMLFMALASSASYAEPGLFLFDIPSDVDESEHLFSTVHKSDYNERIGAQRGAFLNFDKLMNKRKLYSLPIKTVKLQLCFDDKAYIDSINILRKEAEEAIEKDTHINSDEILVEYEEALKAESINHKKEECLKYIRAELIYKLEEYGYFEENLYPDFEKRLEFIDNFYHKNVDNSVTIFKKSSSVKQ